jgi:trehalose 6-phosphate synthase/phosphatase
MAQVLIISNRLPVTVKRIDGTLTYETSMGGLSSGLSGYVTGRNNIWIGWPGIASDDLTEDEQKAICKELKRLHCKPIFLTQKQIDNFYSGYSNGILWPLVHSMKMNEDGHHQRWWKAYREVNKIFAEAVIRAAHTDATIWVHDYQLLLVPALLKPTLAHNHVGFFLHTPFPNFKILSKLPEAKRILQALTAADLIGLQTKANVGNFSECINKSGLGVVSNELLILPGHTVKITDFPIGIDYTKFEKAYQLPDVKRAVRRMRAKYAGLKVIAGVDRLDITKGFVDRLQAYQTFLERNPKQRRKVVFVLVGAPSRSEVPAYQLLAKKVDKLVSEINEHYGTKSWQPVDYIKGLPFHEVTALFQIADVGFVTPLKDGMNLVAKEFVASKRKSGVLILSKGAGAAEELSDALLVDLKQPETLVTALEHALSMRKIDVTGRFNAMNEQIAGHTIHNWAKDFMGALQKPVLLPGLPLIARSERKLVSEYRQAAKRALFLDYDGVLSEFFSSPDGAKPTKEVLAILKRLSTDPNNDIYMISGRSRGDLAGWLSNTGIGLIAEHGAFLREPNKLQWQKTNAADTSWRSHLSPILETYAADTPYAFVEEKSTALVWHYRDSPSYQAQKNLVVLKKELRPLLKQYGLIVHSGKKILEIKHKDTNKGAAVKKYLSQKSYDFILAAGDDYTDENMFKVVPDWAYSLRVGNGVTLARFRIKNVESMVRLLAKLAL